MQPENVAGPSTGPQPVVKNFVAHKEEWEAAGGLRLVKKAVSRFYLVDDSGYRTLTVVGEELPDGHYSYRSVPTFEQFEALDSRARRDVFTWLENIIQTSKASGGVAVLEPEDDPAADGAGVAGFDEHLLFVRYEWQSGTNSEGRRWQKFYLVDRTDKEHLAVEAIEVYGYNYKYTACEPFASVVPLEENCTTKKAVTDWMDNFVTPDNLAGGPGKESPVLSEAQKQDQERLAARLATGKRESPPLAREPATSSQPAASSHHNGYAQRPGNLDAEEAAESDDSEEEDPFAHLSGPIRAAMRCREKQQSAKGVDADDSDDSDMLDEPGIRSAGKGSQPAEQNEYDGIPMLEPEWTRWRTATAYRMACELDQIRVEMLAMFESAANNEMIMASSAEDIVKMINPTKQLLPEVSKVGYTAAAYSRCELMKEALKPHCKPLEPAPEATANAAPDADLPVAAPPEFDLPAPAEPAQKRARTAAYSSRAPSPAISAAVEKIPAPGSSAQPSAPEASGAAATSTAPDSERELRIPAAGENSRVNDHVVHTLPASDTLKLPDKAASLAAAAKHMSPDPAAEAAGAPHDPSSDTPAPSNVLGLASRSGSEAAPASASPNAGGAGATSVGTQLLVEPPAADAPLLDGPQLDSSLVRDQSLDYRMRGSGDAVLRSDNDSDSDSEGLPNACMRCMQVHEGSGGCRGADLQHQRCTGEGAMRDLGGGEGAIQGSVVRLRGSSGDVPMEAPAGEASDDDSLDIVDPSNADAENQQAYNSEPVAGRASGSGDRGRERGGGGGGGGGGTSAAGNEDLVQTALGALEGLGFCPRGGRGLRLTNARIQSAVGVVDGLAARKGAKKPKVTGKALRPGMTAPMAQVGDLVEKGDEIAMRFISSVDRGHKVYGVHAPSGLKPRSVVLARGSDQPPQNAAGDSEMRDGEQRPPSAAGASTNAHACSSKAMGAQLWEQCDREAASEVGRMLESLGGPANVEPYVIRNFEDVQAKNQTQKASGQNKQPRFNTVQAWAPTMTSQTWYEVSLHKRLLEHQLPAPANIVAAAERILQQRLELVPPWWVCTSQLVPDCINVDFEEATALFFHSPDIPAGCSPDFADETCDLEGSRKSQPASRSDSGARKRSHASAFLQQRPPTSSELLTHPKMRQEAIVRLCARHRHLHVEDRAADDPKEPLQGLMAAIYVPIASKGCRAKATDGDLAGTAPATEVVRNPSAWRPLDLRLRGCTDWCEVTGPETLENIMPDSPQWSYWDDLVRVQQNIESTLDGKAAALAFKQTVQWRLLHEPAARWGNILQHDQCLCFKSHPGLPQTFTALPKVMPASKGICKALPRYRDGTGSMPVAASIPESVQRWAEMCGAHFHGALDPRIPPYDPDLDPVLQEMHAEFESMRAYMLAAQDQASEWLTRLVEIAQSLRTFVENLDALLAAHGVRLHLNNQRHHSTHVLREGHCKALYAHPESSQSHVSACDFLEYLKVYRTPTASAAPSSAPSAAPPTSLQPPPETAAV